MIMPFVVLVPALFMAWPSTGSFEIITGAFCAMKILEYSLRGALTETVCMLDLLNRPSSDLRSGLWIIGL